MTTDAAHHAPTKLTAMCIDDSEFDLKLNLRVLNRSGAFADVLLFTAAQDALEHLRSTPGPIDAIFLDINMPVMNGFDFLETASREFGEESFAHSVVIMLTSSLNPKDRKRAEMFAAVHDFLSKPLTVEDADAVAERVRALF